MNRVSPMPAHPVEASVGRVRTLLAAEAGGPGAGSRKTDTGVGCAPALPPDERSDVAIGDWNDLLSAVEARLQRIADTLLTHTAEPGMPGPAGFVRASVLECVSALDQLHTTMTNDAGRRDQLELDIFEAQTALAQSRFPFAEGRADEQLARHLVQHHSRTALPNRSLFRERLDQALAQAAERRESLAVLSLDLDGFKPINDVHGHSLGDEALRIVAARLGRAVRCEDLAVHLGGDEFACLLRGVADNEQLARIARKLFDVVSAPIAVGAVRISVRPSIGISTSPAGAQSADALLRHAELAMNRAKRQQTGHAFFDEQADARVQGAL